MQSRPHSRLFPRIELMFSLDISVMDREDAMEYRIEELISQDDIEKRVAEMAAEIERDYRGKEDIVLVGLLRGSVVFLSDLGTP